MNNLIVLSLTSKKTMIFIDFIILQTRMQSPRQMLEVTKPLFSQLVLLC